MSYGDSFTEPNIHAIEIPKGGKRNTHENTICRDTGSKVSQTDEIHKTKKPNELQTQQTKKTIP